MIDILVLEDWIPRMDWLRGQFPSLDIVKTLKEEEFKQGLALNPSIIILDHDLGLKNFDGYKAAQIIITTIPSSNCPPIIVWSQNPVGSKNMIDLLSYSNYKVTHLMYGMRNNCIIEAINLHT